MKKTVWIVAISLPLLAAAPHSDSQVSSFEKSDRREIQIREISRNQRIFQAEIPFSAPPAAASSTPACKRSPAFIAVLEDPHLRAALSDEFGDERMRPQTVVESKGADVVVRRADQLDALWRISPGEIHSSCISKCMVLSEGARPVRMALSAADGAKTCMVLPNETNSSFKSAAVDCGDGTHWHEVISHPGGKGDWLVCATVVNARHSAPMRHRLSLTYQLLPVVSIGRQ